MRRVDFEVWVKHVLLWDDHRAMRHKRFRYWAFNTMMRNKAAQMRAVFYRQNPGDKDLTMDMLQTAESRQELVKRMVVVTQNIPGTVGERMGMRADLERMVDQIEAETIDPATGKGRMPSCFETCTCAVYKWDQLHTMLEKLLPEHETAQRKPLAELTEEEKRTRFFQDSAANPGFVSWYCAIKLEQMIHFAIASIEHQLQGYTLLSYVLRVCHCLNLSITVRGTSVICFLSGLLPQAIM